MAKWELVVSAALIYLVFRDRSRDLPFVREFKEN